MKDKFISGGYYIVKYVKRPAYTASNLLPERILTTSKCITHTLPDSWAISWVKEEMIDREKQALKFGIGQKKLQEITNWLTLIIDEGKIGIPNVFYSTEDAKYFLSKFNLFSADLVLLGIGIHENLVNQLIESTKSQNVMDGLISCVEKRNNLENNGIHLGYEIYGHEIGGFYHSWLCNHLEKDAFDKFGITPNKYGFIENYKDAVNCAEYFEQPEVEAETVSWFPWRIVKYSLD